MGAGAAILSKYQLENVVFYSKYGEVVISKRNGLYMLVLQSWEGKSCAAPAEIADLTAATGESGYVLRYFAPKIGISEDLATGSAQCSLAPYWFKKLGSDLLNVRQLSMSGGYFQVERTTENLITVFAQAKLRVDAI